MDDDEINVVMKEKGGIGVALTLLVGRAGTGKTHDCLNEMRRELRAAAEGDPLLLILPEHATFKAEKLLASTPELSGFARAAVFGFKRLAQRVLMETGGALCPRINDIGKRLLLAKLLVAHGKDFKQLSRAARQRNFTQTLTAMIEEFKSYAVAPDELARAAEGMEVSALKDKLEDLALVYGAFSETMRGSYTDAEDALDLLAKKLHESTFVRRAKIWVDGFTFFNPQEVAVLREMLKTAQTVTVTLCLDAPNSKAHSIETDLFHRQWKTLRQLRALAAELGQTAECVELTRMHRFTLPELRHLEENLYRFPPELMAARENGGVRVVEAANRRLEAEGVAADILRLCREEGYRWREIGVLVRDGAAYMELLEAVFEDYEIPFFSDEKRRSVHHPLAELLRSALEAINGWRYEPLFRCFKTDFFPAARGQIDLLENYVLEFGIRGARWTMGEDWTYRRRLSLEEDREESEQDAQKLAEINAIRRLLFEPLAALADRMKAAQNVRGMTMALYELLRALAVPQRLEDWAADADARGDLDEAAEHRQLWENIVLFLDQLVETCGEEKMARRDFEAMVNDGLEELTLSLIPPGLDYVTIASFDQNSLDNARAAYVVGAGEGVMPRRGRGEGLLTDADRQRMAGLGLTLSPGAGADNFAERFLVYSALTRATEYLWLSYPLADSEGRGLSPSPLLQRLREMLGLRAIDALSLEETPEGAHWRIARPRRAVSYLATALQMAEKNQALPEIWRDVYNWTLTQPALEKILRAALEGLFHRVQAQALPPVLAGQLYAANKRLKGSVTRFERFRACPFHHFAQYGLKLKERAEYRFAAPDLGQFLHAALKRFGDLLRAEGRDWGAVAEPECGALCAAIVDDLAPKLQNEILLSSAQHQHLLGRIRRTVERSVKRLIAFDCVSAFKPVGLEESFGRGAGALPPLTYLLEDGYSLEITGQIDRVDAMDDGDARYFLVMDYKSGSAYLNLIDVYYGLRLQLMTYLLVAQNSAQQLLGKQAVPAGVLYCFLKNPVLNEKRKLTEKEALEKIDALLKMPGWVLADVDMIRKIDSSFKFIKVSVTTKNAIHAASKNSVKTQEEFAAILNHIGYILSDTGRRILRGDISASPYELDGNQACTYCAYRSFCRFDSKLPEYEYRRLEKLDGEAVMDRIREEAEVASGNV